VEALYGRAVNLQLKGEYDRAIEDFDQVIRLNPDYLWAYLKRAAAYNAKGDYDRAIRDYDRASASTRRTCKPSTSGGGICAQGWL
jgi:tetratricopeptide (TPR) repeat protein